ncbi:unnamed protein product [Rotaria sp. Silwood2]|nr:unnamed protein product [Rotaria sp. Silwood2]
MVEEILEARADFQAEENFIFDPTENELSFHHRVPSTLDDYDWDDITNVIHHMDTNPYVTEADRQIAKQQKQNILSMRDRLSKEKLIIRASYKGYSFSTYLASQFEQISTNYITQSGTYKFIDDINPTNPIVSQNCLQNMIQKIDATLNMLFVSKLITDQQYILMHPKRSTIQLNYLHFVPDIYQEHPQLQPIMICKNGPTFNLAKYLSGILWSMFNQITGCKTFTNSDHAVYTLEQYTKHDYPRTTTYFTTLNIINISAKLFHIIPMKA